MSYSIGSGRTALGRLAGAIVFYRGLRGLTLFILYDNEKRFT